eukprot:COSAG01_NODE_17515_length_1144_cov_1.477512_2_plen_265_part_01
MWYLGAESWQSTASNTTYNATAHTTRQVSEAAGHIDGLLVHIGMAMIVSLFIRLASESYRKHWNNIGEAFNHDQKRNEIEFLLMSFLLVGYVMLVAAASQPLSCHEDLDETLVLAADNSILCDFCEANAGLSVGRRIARLLGVIVFAAGAACVPYVCAAARTLTCAFVPGWMDVCKLIPTKCSDWTHISLKTARSYGFWMCVVCVSFYVLYVVNIDEDKYIEFTYGALWFWAIVFTMIYAVGVPAFIFIKIWGYAKSHKLHTNNF